MQNKRQCAKAGKEEQQKDPGDNLAAIPRDLASGGGSPIRWPTFVALKTWLDFCSRKSVIHKGYGR